LNSSPHVVSVINTRKMKWVGRVARMEKRQNEYTDLVGREGIVCETWVLRCKVNIKWDCGLDSSGSG